jgi:hypothetical protein
MVLNNIAAAMVFIDRVYCNINIYFRSALLCSSAKNFNRVGNKKRQQTNNKGEQNS